MTRAMFSVALNALVVSFATVASIFAADPVLPAGREPVFVQNDRCDCCTEVGAIVTGLENGAGCPFCRRCQAHIDLYGHDLQYFCDRLEPKVRLFRPLEIYSGTFGREAYARAYGYDCRTRWHGKGHGNCAPAAYISHEYVAAINRAVWEQRDAERAKWSLEAAQIDLTHRVATRDVALGKVAEWEKYLHKMVAAQDHCQIEVAQKWLAVARDSSRMAGQELRAATLLVGECEKYLAFAVKRAKNSEKDARIVSHHRRVFVKPPLDRETLRAGLPELKGENGESSAEN